MICPFLGEHQVLFVKKKIDNVHMNNTVSTHINFIER